MVLQMQSVWAFPTHSSMQTCSLILGAGMGARTAGVRGRTRTARSVAPARCSLRKRLASMRAIRTLANSQKIGSTGRMPQWIVEQHSHSGPSSAALLRPRRMSSLLLDVAVEAASTQSSAQAPKETSQSVAARRTQMQRCKCDCMGATATRCSPMRPRFVRPKACRSVASSR